MICFKCKKKPSEIREYVQAGEDNYMTPESYVAAEEGTFDHETDFFVCTECYCEMGMPLNDRLLKLYKGGEGR